MAWEYLRLITPKELLYGERTWKLTKISGSEISYEYIDIAKVQEEVSLSGTEFPTLEDAATISLVACFDKLGVEGWELVQRWENNGYHFLFKRQYFSGSSNGRTPDFESENGGSSPSPEAIIMPRL